MSSSAPIFMVGGGEQGERIRTFDWASTELGPAETWPEALKTVVSIILGSNQPMFVAWGERRVLIYNDAYGQILARKHPGALGADFLEVWSEIRADLEPIVAQTYGGAPVQMDDIQLLMHRRGYPEETHFSFFYTPVRAPSGDVAGFLCACTETTQQVLAAARAERERQQLRLMLRQMPGFVAMLTGPEHRFEYTNDAYLDLVGGRELIGLPVREALPEVEGQGYFDLLDRVFLTGEPFVARASPVRLGPAGETFYVDFLYHALRDDAGEVAGIFVGGYDVTERVRTEEHLSASELRFRGVQETSVDGFMVLESVRDDGGAIVDFRWVYANPAASRIVGRPIDWFPGRKLLEEMPGNRTDGIFDQYARVVETGDPWHTEFEYQHEGLDIFIRLNAARTGDGFAVSFADLSERRRAERELAKSEAAARASAALLEQIIETAPEPIWTKDADGRFTLVNSAAADVMGRERRSLLGLCDGDILPAEVADTLRQEERRILEGGETIRVEENIPHFGAGAVRTFLSTKAPIRNSAGQITGLVGIARDITERRAIEQQRREAVERVQLALDAGAIVGTWVWDVVGDCCVADELFAQTFGLDPEACLRGLPLEAVLASIHPDDRDGVSDAINRALASGGHYSCQYRVRRQDGSCRWLEANGRVELDAQGRAVRFPGVLLDIDERRAVELERDQAVRLLEIFSAAVPGVVYAKDLSGRMLVANRGTTELVGKPSSDYLGKTDLEFLDDKQQALTIMATDRRIMQSGVAEQIEEEVRLADGSPAWWLSTKAPLHDESGVIIGLIGASIDITQRKKVEAELEESQRRLSELNRTLEERVSAAVADLDRVWRNSRDLLVIVGADGVFRAVSPAWTKVLGHPATQIVGRSYQEFVWPEDAQRTQAGLKTATAENLNDFETRYRHQDGGFRWISWHTSVEGDLVYAYGRDITAEKSRQAELLQVQEALRQSQKLESMGQLTGGVAHDFNNLLMPIIAGLDMLQRHVELDARAQRLLDGALQSAERAKSLVQRLLAFARRQPLQPRPVDVGRLCEGMVDLLASTSGPRVRIVLDMAEGLAPVRADPNQLEMALLNLAVNARDAMPDGGQIIIAASRVQIGRDHRSAVAPGEYVRLSVSDTGTGMDELTLERAIEPFFSTKGIGKGTGLGLSMVHGLVAQLGGSLTIQSRLGVGTTIELWLPVATASADVEVVAAPEEQARLSGAALLVDDEDLVRASTAEMLAELGYAVIEAQSAEEAMRLLEGGLKVDVLVTDHLMPGMSGADLIRRLRQDQPDLRALVVSGYAEDQGLALDLPRLTKPFRQHELSKALADLLGVPKNV